MARQKSAGRESTDKGQSVRIATDLARKITVVAIHRDLKVADLLDGVLRPFIEREWAKAVAEMRSDG